MPLSIVESVVYMIECTAQHNNPKQDESAQLFLDADMAIIGVSADAYQSYTEKIKREFLRVPAILYRIGWKKFLKATLDAERIFHSDYFFSRYEKQARFNLNQELNTL